MIIPGVNPGDHVGAYRLESLIGVGGMGEVYRARDTKLQRDVAIKMLPVALATDAERLARFTREAQVLASLNHPHIAQIHGFEHADGTHALVMELVDGDDLSRRIAAGPIPVDEALTLARQIADALEAAHEQGVIHRDLKPANIKVRGDGTVKVLDFGLAKIADEHPGAESSARAVSQSPTITTPAMTAAGTILGTAAYMSPEQAKGRPADKRSDIWAFGCVLYEMLSGERPFGGEDVAETLAAVIRGEPDWSRLPQNTPAAVQRLLRRALTKERRRRTGDVASIRFDLDDAGAQSTSVLPQSRRPNFWRWWAVGASAALVITAVAAARWRGEPIAEPQQLRAEIVTPETSEPSSLSLSPDGTKLAYALDQSGRTALWIRDLATGASRELPGTIGAIYPFWSPDGRAVGFFSDGWLKRLDLSGGRPRNLAQAPGSGRSGASWGSKGVIAFTVTGISGISRVSEDGGEVTVITAVKPPMRLAHRGAHFLPDGQHFVFFAFSGDTGGLYLADIGGGEPRRLFDSDSSAVYVRGCLVLIRGTTLLAHPFDVERMVAAGEPVAIAEGIHPAPNGVAALTASHAGTIAVRDAGPGDRRQLGLFDRTGQLVMAVGESQLGDRMVSPNISDDGRYVAVGRSVGRIGEIWSYDIGRSTAAKLTTGGPNSQPVWSPDGRRIAYISTRNINETAIYIRVVGDPGSERVVYRPPSLAGVTDWSGDERYLLFNQLDDKGRSALWLYSLRDDQAEPLLREDDGEVLDGKISPDNHWIAYQSNQSGRHEIYVRPFEPSESAMRRSPAIQISRNGATQVRWRSDGKELFFLDYESRLNAVSFTASAGHPRLVGDPTVLFPVRVPGGIIQPGGLHQQYDVMPDGQRFLVNTLAPDQTTPPVTLILNWRPPAAVNR